MTSIGNVFPPKQRRTETNWCHFLRVSMSMYLMRGKTYFANQSLRHNLQILPLVTLPLVTLQFVFWDLNVVKV